MTIEETSEPRERFKEKGKEKTHGGTYNEKLGLRNADTYCTIVTKRDNE